MKSLQAANKKHRRSMILAGALGISLLTVSILTDYYKRRTAEKVRQVTNCLIEKAPPPFCRPISKEEIDTIRKCASTKMETEITPEETREIISKEIGHACTHQ